MHKIVEINYDDITIAEEYLNGHDEARCKNALWSMYNVLIEMLDAPTFDGRQTPAYFDAFNMLNLLSKNALFRDADMDTLVWLGEFEPGEGVSAEKYQYIPEEYGFVYSDFVYKDGVKPKKKIDVRNLQRLSLSYTGNDYEDVIFGLKLFADICARHSWPFFRFLDLRVAFKNAAELGLPLGHLWDKPYAQAKVSVEEMCHYFLMDTYLLAGIDNLLALAKQFKMRNHEKSHRSYTFTYRGENVMNIDNHETFDSLEIMLNIGRGEDAAKLLKLLPDNLRTEYVGNLFRLHGEANCKGCWHSAAIQFEEAGEIHWIATCNFGYRRQNPTPEQFKMIEQIITMRINAIDGQKANKKASAKADKVQKTPKAAH